MRYNPYNIFEEEKKASVSELKEYVKERMFEIVCLKYEKTFPLKWQARVAQIFTVYAYFKEEKGDEGVVTKEELLKFIEEENKENEEAQMMGYITWDEKMARRMELDLLYKTYFGEENQQ